MNEYFSQGTRNKQRQNPQERCHEPTSRVLPSHVETRTAVGSLKPWIYQPRSVACVSVMRHAHVKAVVLKGAGF